MESALDDIWNAVVAGQPEETQKLTQRALDTGVEVERIFQNGLIGALESIGMRWKKGEVYLPEVLMAAEAVKQGMGVIRSMLSTKQTRSVGRVMIGTVKGDIHDIGKNLVLMMMQAFGFEVNDLGVNISPERFVEEARTQGVNIIGMSALLSTVLPEMEHSIKLIRASGSKVLILVGGAPVSQDYSERIGANGFAPDAMSGVEKAKELMQLTDHMVTQQAKNEQ